VRKKERESEVLKSCTLKLKASKKARLKQTLKAEMELNKLNSWEASSSSNVKIICTGLSGLPVSSKLYRDIEKKRS